MPHWAFFFLSLRATALAGMAMFCFATSAVHAQIAGTLDTSFYPQTSSTPGYGATAMAQKTDGRLLAGFGFPYSLVHLNSDGTQAPFFAVGGGMSVNGIINGMSLLPDGRVVIAGNFTTLSGVGSQTCYGIARLSPFGEVESTDTFKLGGGGATGGAVDAMAMQADGKILLGGEFVALNGQAGPFFGRLNADGSADTGFTPGVESYVYTVAVQADGKILVGGQFLHVGGQAQAYLARLNANGSLDSDFHVGTGPDDFVKSLAVQADGKILVGGQFTHVNGVARPILARLNSDGSVDSSFNPDFLIGGGQGKPEGIHSIVIQTDGKILAGATLTDNQGNHSNVVTRLSGVDGRMEGSSTFYYNGLGDSRSGLMLQTDGKILLGNAFAIVGSTTQGSMGRLLNDPATQTLSVPDATRVQWMRGGTAPETLQAFFEISADGGATWTQPAPGTRITGGWRLTGLSLPASGLVRARGQTVGGVGNSCSNIVEQVLAFGGATTAPLVSTQPATNVHDSIANLNATVNALGSNTTVVFEYGPDANYGSTITSLSSPIGGSNSFPANVALSNLPTHSTFHYRVKATNASGTSVGADATFTTTNTDATLSSLTVSAGTLTPAFASGTTSYTVSVPSDVDTFTLTSTTTDPNASVQVNFNSVMPGGGPFYINGLGFGDTTLNVVVSAQEPLYKETYTVTVTRAQPVAATFNAATDVPITSNGYTASGLINLTLNFAPTVGTNLTVVNNTGLDFIQGRFSNLAQGQFVELDYNNIAYNFVVNYYGGTGNDLVLQWENTRLVGWGKDNRGQLADNGTQNALIPVAVKNGSPIAGVASKSVLAVATGAGHSLVLYADGTMDGWGDDVFGQLGDGNNAMQEAPVSVDMTGVLSGKTVVAIAAGAYHSLALCSDGTLATWGFNNYGQLGIGGFPLGSSNVPVLVTTAGTPLAGKSVIAIAAGARFSLALCSDGTVAAWGWNFEGELGDGSAMDHTSTLPVAVNTSGVLLNKKVVKIAAGSSHAMALCSDGTLVSWGSNSDGQLGNNSNVNSSAPVLVNTAGVLLNKTVTAMAGGDLHSLVLCSDGTLAAWGNNARGQLGNNSTDPSLVPVAVAVSGPPLAGKTIVNVAAGTAHSKALCADGTVAAWGSDFVGELGNNNIDPSNVPVPVNMTSLVPGELFTGVSSGGDSPYSIAVVAGPEVPVAVTLAATNVTSNSATLNALVTGNGASTQVLFYYGIGGTGFHADGIPGYVSSRVSTPVSADLTNILQAHTTYTFHVWAGADLSIATGSDLTFTTPNTAPIPFFNTPVFVVGHGGAFVPVLTTVYDPDGDALSIQSVTQGSHGSVTIVGTQVLYAADASFAATDTFTFTAVDGFGGSITQTITVCTTAIEKWRVTNFGVDAGNPLIAGDNADPNGNGIPNLVEYALGGDPVHNTSPGGGLILGGGGLILNGGLIINPAARSILPVAGKSLTNTLQLSFTRYPSTGDVTLTVQAADSPAGPWTDLASSITGGTFQTIAVGSVVTDTSSFFIVGGRDVIVRDLYQLDDPAHPQRFMRLVVTRP